MVGFPPNGGKGTVQPIEIRMLNGAFEIYFILKTSIGRCPDGNMKTEMTKELDDAGTAGFGFGVVDMDDAFQHWMKPGKWTDDTSLKTYMKVGGIFGGLTPSIAGAEFCWGLPSNSMPGPPAAVNFFNSIDSKMADLSGAIREHNAEVANLAAAVNAKAGKKTGDALHTIAKIAKKAKKGLFLAPKPNDTFLQNVFTGSAQSVTGGGMPKTWGAYNPYVDLNPPGLTGSAKPPVRQSNLNVQGGVAAATFMQCILDVDTFLSVHKAALDSGIFDNKTSTEFAALAVALGKVPILGSFYAEIVKKLPGFFSAMKNMFEEHYKTIDRMTRAN
jgi:hypothetical protein